MTSGENSQRIRERLGLQLPVRVSCRESVNEEWVEMTRLLDVTPFGARFTLTRPIEQGRLLHLTLPMPRQLRCFDYFERQYRVWALVRYVKKEAQGAPDTLRFTVGVAFIGQHPPESYADAPAKRYEIADRDASGLRTVQEQRSQANVKTNEQRLEMRLNMPIEVTVEVLNENGDIAVSEQTVTENISRRGAAVFTTLDVTTGCFVRLTSKQFKLSVMAVIRARRSGADGIPRLHLEFMDGQFPVEGI